MSTHISCGIIQPGSQLAAYQAVSPKFVLFVLNLLKMKFYGIIMSFAVLLGP